MRTFCLICSKSFIWILLVWKHLKENSKKYETEVFHMRKKLKCLTFSDNILSPQMIQRNQ